MTRRFLKACFLLCESSSAGRARPCQGRGREFESRLSLDDVSRYFLFMLHALLSFPPIVGHFFCIGFVTFLKVKYYYITN